MPSALVEKKKEKKPFQSPLKETAAEERGSSTTAEMYNPTEGGTLNLILEKGSSGKVLTTKSCRWSGPH